MKCRDRLVLCIGIFLIAVLLGGLDVSILVKSVNALDTQRSVGENNAREESSRMRDFVSVRPIDSASNNAGINSGHYSRLIWVDDGANGEVDVNLATVIGIARFVAWGDCVTLVRRIKNMPPAGDAKVSDNLDNFVVIKVHAQEPCGNIKPMNWGFPSILETEDGGSSLLRSAGKSYAGSTYPSALVGFHRIQLSLHNVQLALKNASSDDVYNNQSRSKPAHSGSPVRNSSFVDFMWVFFFLAATAISVGASLKGTEYADNYRRLAPWWWIPCLGFLALAFWFAGHAIDSLTAHDRRPKDVGVMPIVIAKLELGNVEREVLFADFVISADTATLEDRPKSFNRVRVHGADDVLTAGVFNDGVRVFLV
jgi:hypothetical protein